MTDPRISFLCVHNAGRSQMAAAWAARLGGDSVVVTTGGSEPVDRVNPVAVEAMAEVGIDLADAVPRRWSLDDLRASDVIVTMGCGDECPLVPGVRYEDWELADPSGRSLEEVRQIRDAIEWRVRGLLQRLGIEAG